MKARNVISSVLLVVITAVLASAFLAGTIPAAQAERSDREAKSLYKEARKLLNAEEYEEAAERFKKVYDQYVDSDYAADALYWRAFALYRMGSTSDLRRAQSSLQIQLDKYRGADTRDDASELYYRILGQLASTGDAKAAERLAELGDKHLEKEGWGETEHEMEGKLAALHALINMRSEKALPILTKLLKDPDPRKAELREQALFLLAQHGTVESVGLLMHIAKEDPDRDVRGQALFWLSQVSSDKATEFLKEMLAESKDPEMQEKAIFALSQVGDEQALKTLQEIAMDKGKPDEVREQAIFWLGNGGRAEQVEFLIRLYPDLDSYELKEKVIFSVSQSSRSEASQWLLKIVYDKNAPSEVRQQALFWAGQSGAIDLKGITNIYNNVQDLELREQAVFALSQRHDKEAIKLMIDLARKEKDRELRKKLLFWIGQSSDPLAEEFLLEVINE
jgi:HEAT repeat protein